MRKHLEKIKFRKSDGLRALLTEALPYEVPLLFSNEGFYKHLKDGAAQALDGDLKEIFQIKVSIPYDYKIKKTAFELRKLSVMHPAFQREVANFYAKYDSLITALCHRSAYTLRAPVKVASHYVEKGRSRKNEELKEKSIEHERSGFEDVIRTASSYFVYRRFGLIYKFYDSDEFLQLEKKFRYLMRLDIARCFHSIYTHTIGWAIKSKEFSKENRGASFAQDFDSLMQNANYGETAGIIIGPEVSRIFAELILQRVDLNVQNELESLNLIEGRDYSIRRYVDDYFVFCTDANLLDLIAKTFANHLSEFKLSLNASKTIKSERPFLTGESIAKTAVSNTVGALFAKYSEIEKIETEVVDESGVTKVVTVKRTRINYVYDSQRISNSLIQELKEAVSKNGTTFDSISSYFFGMFKRRLGIFLKYLDICNASPQQVERLKRLLSVFIDVTFFVYAMNPRVRPTYQMSEMIMAIADSLKTAPPEVVEFITKKIVDEATLVIQTNCILEAGDNVELLNLLIALRTLGNDYMYEESFLLALFCKPNSDEFDREKFGYFQIVTLLHYVQGDSQYSKLRDKIVQYVSLIFTKEKGWQQKAELACLFLDYIRCPYLDEQVRLALIKAAIRHRSEQNLVARAAVIFQNVGKFDWFFNWASGEDLIEVLRRKELRTAY